MESWRWWFDVGEFVDFRGPGRKLKWTRADKYFLQPQVSRYKIQDIREGRLVITLSQ